MSEVRQEVSRLATLPESGDGVGRVRVAGRLFALVDQPRSGRPPTAIDWAGRRILLADDLMPGQRSEALAAVLEVINQRLRIPIIGFVS